MQRGGCRGVGAEGWVQREGSEGVGAKDVFSAQTKYCTVTSREENKQKHKKSRSSFYVPEAYRCRVYVSPTDVSLTESSWMLRPLNKASLGYFAPDRCVPTLDRT